MGAIITVLIAVVFFVNGLVNKPEFPADITKPLAAEEKLRVSYTDSHIVVQSRVGDQMSYVPDEGYASVSISDNNQPVINVKSKGICAKPGMGISVSDHLYITGDLKVAYWNRFGLHGALGVSLHREIMGAGLLSYQLDQIKLSNTAIYIGYTSRSDMAFGFRVRF